MCLLPNYALNYIVAEYCSPPLPSQLDAALFSVYTLSFPWTLSSNEVFSLNFLQLNFLRSMLPFFAFENGK